MTGFLLCAVITALSLGITEVDWMKKTTHLSPLLLVLIFGMFWRAFFHVSEKQLIGIRFCQKQLLRIAVVGLGFKLSFFELLQIGGTSSLNICIATFSSLLFGFWVSKKMGLSRELGTVLSVGNSICGASAILAAESVLQSEKKESTVALASITVMGTLGIFIYPLLGSWLGLKEIEFGVWSGASLQEMAQVVAAAFGFSEKAVQIAITVKLGRICLLAPLLFFLVYREKKSVSESQRKDIPWIPWFIVGFLVCAGIRSTSWIPEKWLNGIVYADLVLLCIAMTAVGLQTQLGDFKKHGFKPLLSCFYQAIWISAVSLAVIFLSR